MEKCRKCDYWDRKDGEFGECSVYTPAIVSLGDDVTMVRPRTYGDEGCSLHEPKREPEE